MLAVRAIGKLQLCERPLWRGVATTATLSAKQTQMPPRPKINEADIEEKFVKGSGPGGQVINKTSSAVQLLHKPTGIVMKSQATRSRDQNRKIVRRLLAEKLEVIEKGVDSRKQMKEDARSKKKRSKEKKARRKYRKLAEEKAGGVGAGAASDEAENDEGQDDDEEEEDDEDSDAGMVLENEDRAQAGTAPSMLEPGKKDEQ